MKCLSRLVLVRHAESARNVAKKGGTFFRDDASREACKGVADHKIPLTDEGRRHAALTGDGLRARYGVFRHVYDSGYLRAVDTVTGLLASYTEAERAAVTHRHSVFVRERDTGFAYDMTAPEAEAAFPWLHEYWTTTGSFFARPPGGESVAQVCERVTLFLDMLEREHPGESVLVVTHGVTLRAFRFLLEGWSYEDLESHYHVDPPENCSVTVYAANTRTGRLGLLEYNSIYWR